jgi:uncharacterized protein (TIGR02145 family)
MKHLILIALFFASYIGSFGQTKLVIDRRDGKKDSIAVNTISQIRFTSSGIYQPSLFEVITVLDSAKSKFIEYADLTNGDLMYSLDLTENWLMKQPNVKSTFSMGDGYIFITLKSGLKTTFFFDAIDDEGISIYRGGEGGSTVNAGNEFMINAEEILSKNVIENKKVLLFETATNLNLEPQIPIITDILNKAGLALDVTVLKYKQCTAEAVETFKDYGLVIIDGHGQIGSFELGTYVDFTNKLKTEESVKNEIKTQLGSGTAGKVSSGAIELAASVKANPQQSDWVKRIIKEDRYTTWLSGKYIAALPPMPKTIIFGNMCFSGWIIKYLTTPERKFILPDKSVDIWPAKIDTFENPVGRSFIERNLISYYGYTRNDFLNRSNVVCPAGTSRVVRDSFCKDVEKVFVQRLAKDKDSTGIANLKPDNKTEYVDPDLRNIDSRLYADLFFRHYGANNYSYGKCNEPIKDERDGHIYQTVCIGKQVWMAENLAYLPAVSPSTEGIQFTPYYYVYNYEGSDVQSAKASVNYTTYGVLYNWPAAATACPSGWHLPTEEEWTALTDSLGTLAGGKMKQTGTALWSSPNTGATNSSGFSAIPGGNRFNGGFLTLGASSWFWSSEDRLNYGSEYGFNNAWYRRLYYGYDRVDRGNIIKWSGFSVRCVKNTQ